MQTSVIFIGDKVTGTTNFFSLKEMLHPGERWVKIQFFSPPPFMTPASICESLGGVCGSPVKISCFGFLIKGGPAGPQWTWGSFGVLRAVAVYKLMRKCQYFVFNGGAKD